jgi:hypothetical protein
VLLFWIGPLRTAITLLLAIVPWSVSAQTTAQNENLLKVITKLKACVQTYTPAAQAAGVQTTGDAINFFMKTCTPPIGVLGSAAPTGPGMLSQSDFDNIGAIPPGIFRRAVKDEWATFIEETRTR